MTRNLRALHCNPNAIHLGLTATPRKLHEDKDAPEDDKEISASNLRYFGEPVYEYLVAVEWEKTFPLSEAKTFTGAFANQNIVCKLRDTATIEFLQEAFQLDANDGLSVHGPANSV